MRGLEGKVAIVTGAGRGIGRAIALQLAAGGARVVVNDLGVSVSGEATTEDPADAVVREIVGAGGEALADKGSVTDWASAQAMVGAALDRFGRLDIVVNNAGILRTARFDEMTAVNWQAVVAVHLRGSFNLSRAAAPQFQRQASGAYVHMTSASGLVGSTGQANYAAAKLGITALSRSIALEMREFGVRSNCVAPSSASRMTAEADARRQAELSSSALETLQRSRAASQPGHMAPLVAFLASDAAAAINGQVIGARGNEIYLYSQFRAVRSLHSLVPWSMEALAERLPAAWAGSFIPPDRITDVFSWAPV
jgi:NAD(P)-dependent dehydrogenase (short-subunit alcohol dehydrogenase family)